MMRRARLRQVWWSIHRWIGIGLLVLLVPISVSGALLVYHDEFDALSGIYLSFPQQVRSLMSSIAPMQPQQRPMFAAPNVAQPQLTPDDVLALAHAIAPTAQPAALFLPTDVFLTGVFPVVFAFTGVLMWWRGRRMRKTIRTSYPKRGGQEQLIAAE